MKQPADVWWPRIQRESAEKAKNCQQCCQSGKNLKCLQSQNEFGKLPKPEVPNEEISLDFAGSFQNAENKKKDRLVSVHKNTGRTDALFLPDPTAIRVVEFLEGYISKNGIPRRIQTDSGTVQKSKIQPFLLRILH